MSVRVKASVNCSKCRRSQKRIFHTEDRFRCSYCGQKGFVDLDKI